MENREFIDSCFEKCISGKILEKEEIIKLLDIEVNSEEDSYLREKARSAAAHITGNSGCSWAAVGMDYEPCPMNCKFCSFAEKFDLIKEKRHVTEDELLAHIKTFVAGGAGYIALRTTEFYSTDVLLSYVKKIRSETPGNYEILLNTGELDPVKARHIAANGVYGAYHALRLREGQDTPFDPEVRRSTMMAIGNSDLSLMSFLDPVSPEHTHEEIAARLLDILSCNPSMCGVMALFPVKGTAMEHVRMLTEDEIAHITAVVRLSCGRNVRDICAYPSSLKTMKAGANLCIVEAGAIPRSAEYSAEEWTGNAMQTMRQMIKDAGYRLSMPPAKRTGNKKCPCSGTTDEDFIKPVMLKAMLDGPAPLYDVCETLCQVMEYGEPDLDILAELSDSLTEMERCGYIRIADDMCSITERGIRAYKLWKSMIDDYRSSLLRAGKYLDI